MGTKLKFSIPSFVLPLELESTQLKSLQMKGLMRNGFKEWTYQIYTGHTRHCLFMGWKLAQPQTIKCSSLPAWYLYLAPTVKLMGTVIALILGTAWIFPRGRNKEGSK